METVVFLLAATAAVVSALGVVMARNPVHSALSLVGTLFAVAVLFVLQEAHFLAAVQVIVYAGAVVVLFLFVIMLLGVDRHEMLDDPLPFQRPLALAAGAVALFGLLALVGGTVATGGFSARGPALSGSEGNVERIAKSLFTDFIWPFEITSVLLVIAVVGAIVLVREGRPGEAEAEDGDGAPR
ncbi:MAG: NADH-quinone oxidoreductase subunit J [Actinobacteria bacterium]|nr:NADH-quinone oxidoreductase subunit J [Actinomycetota bacterium]